MKLTSSRYFGRRPCIQPSTIKTSPNSHCLPILGANLAFNPPPAKHRVCLMIPFPANHERLFAITGYSAHWNETGTRYCQTAIWKLAGTKNSKRREHTVAFVCCLLERVFSPLSFLSTLLLVMILFRLVVLYLNRTPRRFSQQRPSDQPLDISLFDSPMAKLD